MAGEADSVMARASRAAARAEAKAAALAAKAAKAVEMAKVAEQAVAKAAARVAKAGAKGSAATAAPGRGQAPPAKAAVAKAASAPAKATGVAKASPKAKQAVKRGMLAKAAARMAQASRSGGQAKPPPEPVKEWKAGAWATLVGLTVRADLDGKRCQLVAYAEERERWQIKLEATGELFHVRPANLERPPDGRGGGGAAPKAKGKAGAPEPAGGGAAPKAKGKAGAAMAAPEPAAPKGKGKAVAKAAAAAAPEHAAPKVKGKAVAKAAAAAEPEPAAPKAKGKAVAKAAAPEPAGRAPKRAADASEGAAKRPRRGEDAAPPAPRGPGRPEAKPSAAPGLANGAAKRGREASPRRPVARPTAAPGVAGSPGARDPPQLVHTRWRVRRKDAPKPAGDRAPGETVAQMLRRLVAAAELERGAEEGPKVDSAAVAAELRAAAEGDGDELQGEASRRSRAAKPRKPGDEDDDPLENGDLEDLEGEEAVSDASAGEEGDEEEYEDFELKPVGALPMPDVWPAELSAGPGDSGFNDLVAGCLAKARLGTEESPFANLGLRLHQESAAFLVHPNSPVTRLLVDHATGTGKTLIMLRMLDNYFDDPRPKVAIFPKDRVCDNFYRELLKWPSRWRDFFSYQRPADASLASGAANWKRKQDEVWDLGNERVRAETKRRGVRLEKISKELVESIRDVLEMKNSIHKGAVKMAYVAKLAKEHKGIPVPRAPLRAFRYTTAGGGAAELDRDGWPRSPILKVGFDPADMNPYSSKVVIMDECHNLVRPTAAYEEQLGRLRDFLACASNIVLAGFTGTPVGNDASEGRYLLDVIKGEAALQLNDEGFVSSFHARGSADFPQEVPVKGIPDGVLHDGMLEELVKKHSLHGEALKRYILKEVEFQTIPRLLRLPEEKRTGRLANYCNMHVHYGAYHSLNRTALLHDVKSHSPKMYVVAKSITKRDEKCVVMIAREMGFKVMLEVLRIAGKRAGFKVATLDELGDFNDARKNLRGKRFRVLVAESGQAGEGVQFRHVRRIYLVDVPQRHSELVQRCSRCVRLGGHSDLPPEERSLAVELHVAQLPKFLRQGPASLIYRELLNAKDVSTPGNALEAATEECMKELQQRGVKTLTDLQRELQKDDGERLIDLLTETALEQIGNTSSAPARPMAMALWRLRKGGDDVEHLERALIKQADRGTADEQLLEGLMDKSAELLPPLEAMRLGAVDRSLLAPLGDPPKAPPPRSEASRLRVERAKEKLKHKKSKKEKKSGGDPVASDAVGDGVGAGAGDSPEAVAGDSPEANGAAEEGVAPTAGMAQEEEEDEDDDMGLNALDEDQDVDDNGDDNDEDDEEDAAME